MLVNFLLFLATAITIGCVIPYLFDIVHGKTKPNIVSWLTWTILTSVATVAQLFDGEYITSIFTASAVVSTGLVVIFGLKYGYVKYTTFDVICQLSVLVGLFLWWFFNSPALAVVAAVTIDFIGALPTIRHSWNEPSEETWITFALSGLGGFIVLFAITSYTWSSLSYPIYIVGINVLIASIILLRKRQLSAVN